MQPLGLLPGDNASQAFAINNQGQAVGYSSGPAGMRPFLWTRNAGMQYLGTLEGSSGMALAISDSGYVVGRSQAASGSHAFFWSSTGGMVDLGTLPGHTESQAMGVNNIGTTVGFSGDAVHSQPVIWIGASRIAPLPLLTGGDVGRALAVNNLGQVVGFSTATDHAYRAVTWGTDGIVRDLNSLVAASAGVYLLEAQAINDRGQILTYGLRLPINPDLHENPGRMFLLTPARGAAASARSGS
jgi:probable HAF family extracellular repeat protein